MNPRSIARADAQRDASSSEGQGLGKKAIPLQIQSDVSSLARTLAAMGGGSVSADLALDLVLNEVVEQARAATAATGAAIALERDGEVICRATSGNAPELGVRVETTSGLSGACLRTAEIQSCGDTEIDPRVNAEACRRLHVRSILMIPILDRDGAFGILEVFAPGPSSFTESDVKTLQLLAQRVADTRLASQEPVVPGPVPVAMEQPAESLKPDAMPLELAPPVEPVISDQLKPVIFDQPKKDERRNYNEVLTSVLVVLVIAAAILLGLVVGVRVAIRRSAASTPVHNDAKPVAPPAKPPVQSTTPSTAPPQPTAARPATPPAGGLIVTQGGKVIYRADPSKPIEQESPPGLIHRVDPVYPESAKAQHLQGQVVLDAEVMGDGSVGDISIVRGDPLLAEAATEAVKQWKFEPSTIDGKPVGHQERITVKFALPTS